MGMSPLPSVASHTKITASSKTLFSHRHSSSLLPSQPGSSTFQAPFVIITNSNNGPCPSLPCFLQPTPDYPMSCGLRNGSSSRSFNPGSYVRSHEEQLSLDSQEGVTGPWSVQP
ncbi:hypothetical protein K435DRAFT_861227 [Dendrothele bispora CBS 962.96]|uniref:Uncharacterized protein n=1 Tax=Dendrothele bispora (strain CBS 962.96) TaxID=1314807 RepID=A0A4S8LX48_DENBC|nr:hypothetical protein K435DRAFT_861227 [Dendrothele bispora CBS 962.96]